MFDCKFKFKILTVLHAQERGLFQNGDEPYFVFFGLRSRFHILDSSRIFWSGYINDHWAKGTRDGSSRNIPAHMGLLTFPDVNLVSNTQLLSGLLPEVIGVVGIAMESDATASSTVMKLMRKVHDAIHAEADKLIERAEIRMDDPHPDIVRSIIALQDNLTLKTREEIKSFIGSHNFTDDLISVQARICVAGDKSVHAWMPELEMLETKNIHMDFTGNGASYRASGFLDMVPDLITEPA